MVTLKRIIILVYKRSIELLLTPIILVGIAFSILRYLLVRNFLKIKPHVLLGPMLIVNNIHLQKAFELYGYKSGIFSYSTDSIVQKYGIIFSINNDITEPFLRFLGFLYAITTYDIIFDYFTNKFLHNTYLEGIELNLLKLACKKIILAPYGSDIAVPGYLDIWEKFMIEQQPSIVSNSEKTKKTVNTLTKYSDCVIKTSQPGYLPFFDVWTPTFLAINTKLHPLYNKKEIEAHGEIVILHSSNHRKLKKTNEILDVVYELKREGYPIKFILLEKVSNKEVHLALRTAHIVIDQLIIGYGMFAVEAMAAGAAVLSNMEFFNKLYVNHPIIKECPIINVNEHTLKDNLKKLIENPNYLQKAMDQCRNYVTNFHSLEAVGKMYNAIFEYVWNKTELPKELTINVNPFPRS